MQQAVAVAEQAVETAEQHERTAAEAAQAAAAAGFAAEARASKLGGLVKQMQVGTGNRQKTTPTGMVYGRPQIDNGIPAAARQWSLSCKWVSGTSQCVLRYDSLDLLWL